MRLRIAHKGVRTHVPEFALKVDWGGGGGEEESLTAPGNSHFS